jgi:hypothetical protein
MGFKGYFIHQKAILRLTKMGSAKLGWMKKYPHA